MINRCAVVEIDRRAHHLDVDGARVASGVCQAMMQAPHGSTELIGILDGCGAHRRCHTRRGDDRHPPVAPPWSTTARMTSGCRKSSGAVGSSMGYSRVYFIDLPVSGRY
ncbi:hypothetical protein [Mycolicibacterium porcinum]|uniref:PPM-type phosphatase domain-containing protein n=1 Tax=Mycolicibacterium porcinum TaxID=39693 RepID=A0AAW5T4S8_9MYCO|nr:hypothetical protein [Mycolicibacterium porcinum]MCV7389697.1 hypothetical protein [Mycolicibacterium porcinum]ORB40002.1 hypothetical protein BST41_15070 [Mycolicibacterium porcinum]